jgi:hypothetical protein
VASKLWRYARRPRASRWRRRHSVDLRLARESPRRPEPALHCREFPGFSDRLRSEQRHSRLLRTIASRATRHRLIYSTAAFELRPLVHKHVRIGAGLAIEAGVGYSGSVVRRVVIRILGMIHRRKGNVRESRLSVDAAGSELCRFASVTHR